MRTSARGCSHSPVNCGPRGRELVPPVPARGSPRGAECVYCLTSAAISFSLFAIGLSGVNGTLYRQGCAGGVFGVHRHRALPLRAADGRLLPGEHKLAQAAVRRPGDRGSVHIVQQDGRLAAHLKSVGAKMYGAFNRTARTSEFFGAGADIPHVECFPNGWERGTPVAAACSAAEARDFRRGFPADGQKLEGEKTLAELAKLTGYEAPGMPGALPTAPGLGRVVAARLFLSQ